METPRPGEAPHEFDRNSTYEQSGENSSFEGIQSEEIPLTPSDTVATEHEPEWPEPEQPESVPMWPEAADVSPEDDMPSKPRDIDFAEGVFPHGRTFTGLRLTTRDAAEVGIMKKAIVRGVDMECADMIRGREYTNPSFATPDSPRSRRYNGLLLPDLPNDTPIDRTREFHKMHQTRERISVFLDTLLDDGAEYAVLLFPQDTARLVIGLLGIVRPPEGWDAEIPSDADKQAAEALLQKLADAYQYHEGRGEIGCYGRY